jgi:hypothetical protein
MQQATFVKMGRNDSEYPDMIFSLSEPRPYKIDNGHVVSTSFILVMNTYYFGAHITTLALPCDENGETESYLSNHLGELPGEHNAEKLLTRLGYSVDWGKSAPQSIGS